MKTAALFILGSLIVASLSGCVLFEEQPTLQLTIEPGFGNVPFEATIHAFAPPGEFTFELPDSTIIQEDSQLDVIVDSLNWSAIVRWTDGKTILTQTIEAAATNPRPSIQRPIINGDMYLWQLEPLERTLVSFANTVRYNGEWRVSSIEISADPLGEFTVFYPPYEAGVCQAEYYNIVHRNSCIVYPNYKSIETSGLPYSPTALDTGYPFSGSTNTNAYRDEFASASQDDEEYSALQATIVVEVIDEWDRVTSASFTIRVNPLDYTDLPFGNDQSED